MGYTSWQGGKMADEEKYWCIVGSYDAVGDNHSLLDICPCCWPRTYVGCCGRFPKGGYPLCGGWNPTAPRPMVELPCIVSAFLFMGQFHLTSDPNGTVEVQWHMPIGFHVMTF